MDSPRAGAPDLSITIDQEYAQVDVEPGSDGVIRFTGTVYCDLPASTPPGQKCIVTLHPDAGGWPCSTPDTIEFERNNEEEDFTIAVQVPIETSTRTNARFSVSGRWNYSPGTLGGSIDPATSILEILPYTRPQVSMESDNNSAPVGQWCEIKVGISNEGNADDEFQLELDSIPDGVEAYLEEDTISVDEKRTETVILKARQTRGAPRTFSIDVIATGTYNGSRTSDWHPVVFSTTMSARSFFTTPYMILPSIILPIVIGLVVYIVVRRKMGRRSAMEK